MKLKIIVGIITVFLLGYLFLPWARNFLAVDSCLDRGGRWNEEINECEDAKFPRRF